MAQDVEALELLHLELTKLEALNNPPKDSDKIETFQNECSVKIASTQILFQDITAYTKAINDQMEMARKVLDESTAEVQKRIQEIADSITGKLALMYFHAVLLQNAISMFSNFLGLFCFRTASKNTGKTNIQVIFTHLVQFCSRSLDYIQIRPIASK